MTTIDRDTFRHISEILLHHDMPLSPEQSAIIHAAIEAAHTAPGSGHRIVSLSAHVPLNLSSPGEATQNPHPWPGTPERQSELFQKFIRDMGFDPDGGNHDG